MVRNVLSPEEVAKLEAAGDYLDAHAEEVWDARGQERNLLAVDPDNFLPMLTHPVALPLVAQLCGALPFPHPPHPSPPHPSVWSQHGAAPAAAHLPVPLAPPWLVPGKYGRLRWRPLRKGGCRGTRRPARGSRSAAGRGAARLAQVGAAAFSAASH